MVLGLKPMGKSTTYQYKSSFGQNQGIVWSSDSNLWGNQLLISINQVLDRTKVLYCPWTQTYGETNYLDEKTKFWTQTYGKVGYLIKISNCSILGSSTRKSLRLWKLLGKWWNTLLLSGLQGLFISGLYVFGWLPPTPYRAFSCHLGYFGVSVVFSGRHYCAKQPC